MFFLKKTEHVFFQENTTGIISHQPFLKLDGICKIEFWTLYS